jgi:two-component system nitrate/nitrite response regulator NarL
MLEACALNVLVVDDHDGVRAGIASLIDAEQPRLRTVGVAANAEEALAKARSLQPHVVLLDVDLAGEDGLALIPALHRVAPCVVVVLSSFLDPNVAVQAARLGARAYVHKGAPASKLVDCLLSVRHGDARQIVVAEPSESNVIDGEAQSFVELAHQFVRQPDAVTAMEYALMAFLVAIFILGAVQATGNNLSAIYVAWSAAVLNAL